MAKMQGTKNRRAAEIKEQEILSVTKDLSFDSVSSAVAATQVEVQKALAEVSGKLQGQLDALRAVEDAIQLRRDELKALHQIEVTAQTLDELEAEIRKQRQTWEEEQAQKKRDFEEQRSDRNKAWKREEEEYQYRIAQEHRKLEDSFKALMAQRERENLERQRELEKTWAEREGELKKREVELAELRSFKEQAPEMIKKAENAAGQIAGNSVKKEYETKMQLTAKDAETNQRLADQEIRSLTENLKKQQTQIDDLKAQIEQAHQRVADISAKALDSASGRATTDALQRLLEKDSGGGKPSK